MALIATSVFLSACGGGGGGSTPSAGGGGGGGGSQQPLSVSGDMLAYSANRGWNYHGTNGSGGAITISTYADPEVSSGGVELLPLIGTGVVGTVTTVLTSNATAEEDTFGGLGLSETSGGYQALDEISAGGGALVPGSPTFIPSTLTQGQTFSPYAGTSATVTFVGTVPGSSACPSIGNGATVQYSVAGGTYTVSYEPGCGITQYSDSTGISLTLASVASYQQIGSLSAARKLSSVSPADTVRTVLGLNHQPQFGLPIFSKH